MSRTLRALCRTVGPTLPLRLDPFEGAEVDAACLLWALAGVESSYGRDRLVARIEPSYQPRGVMYVRSPLVRARWAEYGALAACSWGTWQMMAPTAWELGFTGDPWRLVENEVLAPLVVRYVASRQPRTLPQVFDAYNSGSCRDRIVPEAYIHRGLAAYRAGWAAGPAE